MEFIELLSIKEKNNNIIVDNKGFAPFKISLNTLFNADHTLTLLNNNKKILSQVRNSSKHLEQLYNLLCHNENILQYNNILKYLKDKKDIFGRNLIHYLCQHHHYDSLDYIVVILITKYNYGLYNIDDEDKTYFDYIIKYNEDNLILIEKLFNIDMKINKKYYSKL